MAYPDARDDFERKVLARAEIKRLTSVIGILERKLERMVDLKKMSDKTTSLEKSIDDFYCESEKRIRILETAKSARESSVATDVSEPMPTVFGCSESLNALLNVEFCPGCVSIRECLQCVWDIRRGVRGLDDFQTLSLRVGGGPSLSKIDSVRKELTNIACAAETIATQYAVHSARRQQKLTERACTTSSSPRTSASGNTETFSFSSLKLGG